MSALRADAQQNRQRIIDAASKLFKRAGIDVPLEDIAREAGVGIATLYRRFPNRSELTAAAFAQQASVYVDVIDAATAEPNPWEGLCRLVNGLCELQASDAGLRQFVTMTFPDVPEVQEMVDSIESKIESLLDRAKYAGSLRPDATTADIVLMLLGNNGILGRSWPQAEVAWRRYAALFLDSLRPSLESAPLPPAPSPDTIREALKNPYT